MISVSTLLASSASRKMNSDEKVDTRNAVKALLKTQISGEAATDISQLVSNNMSKEEIDKLYLQMAVDQNKMTHIVKYMFYEMQKLGFDLHIRAFTPDLEMDLEDFFDFDSDDEYDWYDDSKRAKGGPFDSLHDVYLRLLQSDPEKIKEFFTDGLAIKIIVHIPHERHVKHMKRKETIWSVWRLVDQIKDVQRLLRSKAPPPKKTIVFL